MNLNEIKKILIIRYRFVGDTVISIPFIKSVKEHFPNSVIDVLVSPKSGELILNNPAVNNVFFLDTTKKHKYEKSADMKYQEGGCYSSIIECGNELRKRKYDLVFVLKRSFSSAVLSFLTGAKYRVGFNTELRSFLLTHPVKYDMQKHELENFLSCLKILGSIPQKHLPEIYTSNQEKLKANSFLLRLDRNKPKVLIHATSAHPYKIWPKRYFAKLMDFLFEETGAQFVFTGAKMDKAGYDEILSWCRNKKKMSALNLCGFTSLRECYEIYKGLNLAICVDSGNAHIAGASGIPTYVLYGPTSPAKWLPVGKAVYPITLSQTLPCQPCDVKVQCDHLSCMKILTPEFVFGKLHKVLENYFERI